MNDPQMIQLQQEAAQRVQRMAERSRRLVREHPVHVYHASSLEPCVVPPKREPLPPPPPPSPPSCPCVEEEMRVAEKPCVSPIKGASPCKAGTFLDGVQDREQLLLLLLAVMLLKNGAPTELLLALLYVAL